MADLTSYAAAFASPVGGDTSGVVRTLSLARLNSTRKRIAAALAASREAETAQALRELQAGNNSAWRPESGLALMACRNQHTRLAALQVAAAYAGMGASGQVATRLDHAQWLYVDGWLTAVDGNCSLKADGQSIVVESDLGVASYQVADDSRWLPVANNCGPWTAVASGGLAPRYVTVSGLRHSVEGFPWISGTPVSGKVELSAPAYAEASVESINKGWSVIVKHAPAYGAWVASTARGCLLIEPSGSHSAQSGSSFDHPGLIAIEPPECGIYCGEILVHECSHQQLLVYSLVVPLVTPGSEETSYSPIKRATRSIDRVLTGAHAVGNMILYYATVRRSLELDALSQQRFAQHCQWFAEDYRPALDRSKSLTVAGRAFWNSLCNAVDQAVSE